MKLHIVSIGMLFAVPAMAAAAVIDFDGLANGTVVTNQYAEATFSSSAGSDNYAYSFSGADTPPNILCTGPTGGGVDCIRDTYIDFTLPVDLLTFWAIEPNATGVVAQFNIYENYAYSATENLIGLGGSGNKFVDLSAYSNVTRLEIVNILNDPVNENGIGWDTFSFRQVPEPASLGLLALGLLTLARRRG